VLQEVLNYKPSEQDYRIWLVLNPAVWLIPIGGLVLLVALAAHAMVFSMPEYSWTKTDDLAIAQSSVTNSAEARSAPVAEQR